MYRYWIVKLSGLLGCVLWSSGMLVAEDSPGQRQEKLSAAYLQKAYHSLKQAAYYVDMSKKTAKLPLFDYSRLERDLKNIQFELGKYLYPGKKDYGEATKVTIDGRYFLEGIKNATRKDRSLHTREKKD